MTVTWEVVEGPAVVWSFVGDDPEVRWAVYVDGSQSGGDGVSLSNDPPQPLGPLALPGVSNQASRADHVHQQQYLLIDDLVDVQLAVYEPLDVDDVFIRRVTEYGYGWTNIPIRKMADASRSSAVSAGLCSHTDFTRLLNPTQTESVHLKMSNGTGCNDPLQWIDGRTSGGPPADPFLEEAYIANGELRHRGTRPAAAAAMFAQPHVARWATAVVAEWYGGSGFADIRIGFVSIAGDGYLAYLRFDGTDHHVAIVRDDAQSPTIISSVVTLPSGTVTEGRRFTLAHHGQTFRVLLDGAEIVTATDATHDVNGLDYTNVVLASQLGSHRAGITEFAWGTGVLPGDGTGSGDVTGPSDATDGHAAVFDGPTGKVIRSAGAAPVLEGDSRLSDARTPTAHAASHADGGADEIAVDASQVTTGTINTARLGSGVASSATFLRGDQTWAVPPGGTTAPACPIENGGPVRPGEYLLISDAYAPGGNSNSSPRSTTTNTNGFLMWIPVRFHEQFTFDRMACRVTTANDGAGAVVRLGVYNDNDGQPGSLLLDAGSASINTTGVKIIVHTATTLNPGLWWFALVCNGLNTGGANPTLSCLNSNQRSTGSIVTPQDSNTAFRGMMDRSGVSGALPNPAGASTSYGGGAFIWHIYLRRQP